MLAVYACYSMSFPPAQHYRLENVYEGPMEDEAANAFRACDPAGPPIMQVIASGPEVRDQGSHDKRGSEEDPDSKSAQRTVPMLGRSAERSADVPRGNVVALVGADDTAPNKVDVTFSASPVAKVTVQVGDSTKWLSLVEDVEKPSRAVRLVRCATAESREQVLATCG